MFLTRAVSLALGCVAGAALSACGSATGPGSTTRLAAPAGRPAASHRSRATLTRLRPRPPVYPTLLAAATDSAPTDFVPAISWRGRTAVWIARRSGLALLSFDQRLLELRLHSGTVDAGTAGWRFGPSIGGPERHRLVAAFNGAFKLATGAGGFESYGRVAAALAGGLGSIVTYANGSTDVGAWRQGVPAAGEPVVSVRQNLHLLIAGGRAAGNTACLSCWGATLGGVSDPARSALGITADGHLVWAGGEHLTVTELADALLGARVVRAVELDINPEWVAGYLYGHDGGLAGLARVPVAPGQPGVPGQFLSPYSRDFFTILAR